MYLPDHELEEVLPQLKIQSLYAKHPFEADEQVQPSSIDLRLDYVFWRPRKHRPIDLRRAALSELDPRRYWEKVEIPFGQAITLRKGEMLLGRTVETFTIPPQYAGKLEGRSSFARMGLAIHCSADFINPGYRGNMPLQLINYGPSSIKLIPLIPICQLVIVKLLSAASRPYNERQPFSKYMDDDGGPTYWWRDHRIKKLQESLGRHHVELSIQDEILKLIGPCEPDLIERFESTVEQLRIGQLANARELLDLFSQAENTARKWAKFKRNAWHWVGLTFLAISIGSFFAPLPSWHFYASLLALTAVFLSISAWIYFCSEPPGDYLGEAELGALIRQKDGT
ncbi:MAG: dCTP deaminase [Planctomycetota bacterium]|nr:MAG: dCTP deaminase [Planctomycetota bacterium]REK22485.1 MAG: dCTP deaminase [Planctomycetota bacterium]REK47127.1 MAG: dCTP deaminase [Planctomycetota bacterium]